MIRKSMGLLAVAVLLCGCIPQITLAKQTFTFELGADIYANPSLYVKDGDNLNLSRVEVTAKSPGIVKSKNRFVTNGSQFLSVGEYDFALEAGENEYPFTIKVKDTKAPSVKNNIEEVDAYTGQSLDWDSLFQAEDLSGVYYEAPSGITDTPGDQEVSVKISDRFGNSVSKDIVVHVG